MIWTEEQKTEMRRLRDEGVSNNLIGQIFGVSGDIVRKVLLRYDASKAKERHERLMREVRPPELQAALDARPDSLRRIHDEFDAKAPGRASSRPKWAGRPPLRVTPKDFQKERFNPEE